MFSVQGMYPGSPFVEAWVRNLEPTDMNEVVRFTNLQGFSEGGQNRDGWVDVRGCKNLVVLAKATTQAATIKVESLRTIMDSPNNLVAEGSHAAPDVSTVYDDPIEGIAYIRVLCKYTSLAGGTVDISIFAE